jgi:hypothetical protein
MTDLGTCPDCGHLIRLTPTGTLAHYLRDGVLVVRSATDDGCAPGPAASHHQQEARAHD